MWIDARSKDALVVFAKNGVILQKKKKWVKLTKLERDFPFAP